MSKMQKKTKKGAPSWMVSFCDLMQLLLTFFIMLFSTSSTDAVKLQELLTSFSGGQSIFEKQEQSTIVELDTKEKGESEKPDIENEEDSELTSSKIETLKEQLDEQLSNNNSKEAQIIENELKEDLTKQGFSSKEISQIIEITSSSEGVLIRFKDGVLFDPGATEIKEDGQRILKILGGTINKKQELKIEGHTDDIPTGNSIYKTNWELSTARAISVMSYLTNNKYISEKHCSIAGYSEFKPLAENISDKNRALNRRVDILIVNP